jgi:flagellar assembly factor FliW
MSVATLETPEATDVPVIDFVAPMPGFPEDRHFVLVRVEDSGVLYALRSMESPGLRFLVVPPAPFFPDYAPEIDDETIAALGVTDPEDLLVLLVLNAVGDDASDVTANLMAPIVLDKSSRRAVQLVLARSGLPVRQRLMSTE